jgi:transposase
MLTFPLSCREYKGLHLEKITKNRNEYAFSVKRAKIKQTSRPKQVLFVKFFGNSL